MPRGGKREGAGRKEGAPNKASAARQAEVAAWLQVQAAAGSTALLLSTCNRCEIYWTGGPDLEAWFRDFALTRGAPLGEALLRLDGEAAVRHLFDVVAGLDSQVLGEAEVLGQVRRAYDAARSAGTTNRLIDTVGNDLSRLSLAVEQLGLYAGDRPVTSDDVDDLIADTRERSVFNPVGRIWLRLIALLSYAR